MVPLRAPDRSNHSKKALHYFKHADSVRPGTPVTGNSRARSDTVDAACHSALLPLHPIGVAHRVSVHPSNPLFPVCAGGRDAVFSTGWRLGGGAQIEESLFRSSSKVDVIISYRRQMLAQMSSSPSVLHALLRKTMSTFRIRR